MNLIKCTNNCKHQLDGYCTLDKLDAICVSPINDCIYYSSKLSENTFKITDISDRYDL